MVKRIISILFICSVALYSRTTIAIFDFENNGLESYEVRQLSKRLESELVKLGNFDIVERTSIDEILKEQKIQASGCTETCLLDVGMILGASQIVYGSIGKFGNLYTISAKLVDAETGKPAGATIGLDVYGVAGVLPSLKPPAPPPPPL